MVIRTRGTVGIQVLLVLSAVTVPSLSQPPQAATPNVIKATLLKTVRPSSGEVLLRVRVGTQDRTLHLEAPHVPQQISRLLADVALPATDLPAGSELRIIAVSGEKALDVGIIEQVTGPPAEDLRIFGAEVRGYSLWYSKRFFALDGLEATKVGNSETRRRLSFFLTARAIAAHAPLPRDRTVWIRGSGATVLATYADSQHAAEAIRNYGPISLLNHLPALHETYVTAGKRTVIARAVLARPQHTTGHPIGTWITFPIEVYSENPTGELQLVLDVRSAV